jgi:hypothetical protein
VRFTLRISTATLSLSLSLHSANPSPEADRKQIRVNWRVRYLIGEITGSYKKRENEALVKRGNLWSIRVNGRLQQSHCGGQGFKSPRLHQQIRARHSRVGWRRPPDTRNHELAPMHWPGRLERDVASHSLDLGLEQDSKCAARRGSRRTGRRRKVPVLRCRSSDRLQQRR